MSLRGVVGWLVCPSSIRRWYHIDHFRQVTVEDAGKEQTDVRPSPTFQIEFVQKLFMDLHVQCH